MIDNVTITLNDCDCKLPTLWIGSRHSYSIYRLYLKTEEINPAYLRIEYSQKYQILRIIGSVRKWYLGMFSLSDLTSKQFADAIEEIARLLSIDISKFFSATITKCEIGLNVQTRIPAKKVNEVIRGYDQFLYYRYGFETVGFLSENKKLKLYDKCKELIKRFGKDDTNDIAKKHFEELKAKEIYIYRIEITLIDSRSFKLAGLEHLSTIGGLIDNYPQLVSYWINECSKIEVGLGINFDDDRITKTEYAILVALYHQGYNTFLNGYSERSINRKNNKGKLADQSAINAKSNSKKEIEEILTKYRMPNSYHFASFRIDIFRTLKKLYGNSTKSSTKELVLGLWGKT